MIGGAFEVSPHTGRLMYVTDTSGDDWLYAGHNNRAGTRNRWKCYMQRNGRTIETYSRTLLGAIKAAYRQTERAA